MTTLALPLPCNWPSQRLARPWYRARVLRVFRDVTGLSASGSLKASLRTVLDRSEHLILLASPKSASSHWVNQEVTYWLTQSPPKPMLITLIDGEIEWPQDGRDFDWNHTNALPTSLSQRFESVPLWVDFRTVIAAGRFSLRDAQFRDSVP